MNCTFIQTKTIKEKMYVDHLIDLFFNTNRKYMKSKCIIYILIIFN